MKILFTNAGRRTYLIQYALQLVDAGYPLQVCVSDASRETAAFHVDPRTSTFITPLISDGEDAYAECVLDICAREQIRLVVPLMDFELPVLSRYKNQFLQNGTQVWVSSPNIVDVCLNKQRCYQFCMENNIPTPRSWFELPPHDAHFPLIKKRILGSGSVGQRIIHSREQLDETLDNTYFYQEMIQGSEYGMDILNDWDGQYVHSYYRRKLLMRAGETDKAHSLYKPEFEQTARTLSQRFRHVGNLDLDFLMTHEGKLFFIDFNPRFGGGYPFTHHSGFNYVKALIDLSHGRKPQFSSEHPSIAGMKGLKLFHFNLPATNNSNTLSPAHESTQEIMLSAAGRRVALLRLLKNSSRDLGWSGQILAADISSINGTYHIADRAAIVPPYKQTEDCLKILLQLCRKHQVRLIIPTIDSELPFYATHHPAFMNIGTHVLISSEQVIHIGNNKAATHKWLSTNSFPVPRQIDAPSLLKDDASWTWPLFAKPVDGSSSIGAGIVRSRDELQLLASNRDYIVQEIAPGVEYTVDVYVDKSGKCRCAVPRLRIETRGGEVVKGMTVRNPAVIDLAQRIAEALPGAWGVLNIQIFHDAKTGTLNVIEINPRFGGGYPLSHQAGAHMTQWVIEETLGLPCSAHDNWQDGLVMLRYDDAIFVTRQQAGITPPINPINH